MASLSGSSSGGVSNWDKYVKLNTAWNTTNYPMDKNATVYSRVPPSTRVPANHPISGYLSKGDLIKIGTKVVSSVGQSKYARIKSGSITGYVKLSEIGKPTRRGGADAEQRTLDLTKQKINDLEYVSGLGRGSSSGIALDIPGVGFFLGITDVEKVPNRIHGREAKSDFVLKNSIGKKILFISHKDGNGPKAFGQYGGVSTKAGGADDASQIYNHPEVQTYLNKLYRLYQDGIGPRTIPNNPFLSNGRLNQAVMHKIKDSRLVNESVYGPDYGGAKGPDNVHLIGQGQFVFKPLVDEESGDLSFKLGFSGHMSLNGDTRDFMNDASGYRAVLITTYRGRRPTQTPGGPVPETRTAIYPRSYRENAIDIDRLL